MTPAVNALDLPRDRRILVWIKKDSANYGTEHGWFTAQYDGTRTNHDHDDLWRIGLDDIETFCCIRIANIAAWRELPEPFDD